jgi:hypothetical protein
MMNPMSDFSLRQNWVSRITSSSDTDVSVIGTDISPNQSWEKTQQELSDLVRPLMDKHFNGFDKAIEFRDKLRGEKMASDERVDFERTISLARLEAVKATAESIRENPDNWYPCGFAWVVIKPARGKFVSFLKEKGIGYKSESGGWRIWNPSEHPTQSMEAKMRGAMAFVQVLKENGINAIAECRMD